MMNNMDVHFKEVNFRMVRGDTFAFNITFSEDTTLTGADFTIRDSSDTAVVHKSLSSGIAQTASDQYRVTVAPADTEGLAVGKYTYGLKLWFSATDAITPMLGVLYMIQNETR